MIDTILLIAAFLAGAVLAVLLLRRRSEPDPHMAPLKESLDKVDVHLRALESERAASHARLTEQLRALSDETSQLARALRSSSARGSWGELQLRRAVELAGMLEHCDFTTQTTLDSGQRPDLIVHLPNGRSIAVDAKAPLTALLDGATPGEPDLERHARLLRGHISRLAAKSYWAQFERSPDFVVAFLPGESLYSAALEADPSLLEFGVENRVLIATPTTLIALLRAVAMGWREERLARNAEEISALGRELYTRLGTLSGYFDDLRKSLDKSVEAYNRAAGALESRVLVSARRLSELGVASREELAAPEPVERATRPLVMRAGGSSGEAAKPQE